MNDNKLLDDKIVNRTPNPNCPVCIAKRQHNDDEWAKYHPLAGTGFFADVARS
jgi:hypothetical protein